MRKKNLYKYLLWITTMAITCLGTIDMKPLNVYAEENKNTMNIRAILMGEKPEEMEEEPEGEKPEKPEEPGNETLEGLEELEDGVSEDFGDGTNIENNGEAGEQGILSMEINFDNLSYTYNLTTGNWEHDSDEGSFEVKDTSSNTENIEGYETATLSFSYTPNPVFEEIAVGTIKKGEDVIEDTDSIFLKDHREGILYTLELENKMENKKQASEIVTTNLKTGKYSTIGTLTCSMKCDISVDNGKEEEDGK